MLKRNALFTPAALAVVSLALQAQEVVELEKFEVTSQKRTQAIHEVPIAVTAYSGDFLERTGITDYQSLAPFVPGLFIQEQSPNNPGINVRGITTDSGDPRNETRVSLFQDGVSISRSRGSVVELFDLERVEVLKGPQGTLFGRGAQIGALSLIQNKAKNETSGSLGAGFGNHGDYRLNGVYNAPLVENQLFGRVAVTYREHDGVIDNLADGSELNGKKTLAARTALRWQPSDRTTADLIINYQNDHPPGTSFKSGVIPTSAGDTDPFAAAELNRGSDLYIDRTVWGLSGIVEHELNDAWTLTSITGWREFDSHEEFDADGSGLYLLEFAEDAKGRQLSQEVRLNFDTGGRFTGFVGAGYFWEDGEQRAPVRTSEQALWPFLSGSFREGLIAAGVPGALASAAVPPLNPFAPQATLPATFALFAHPALPASLQALSGLAGVPLQSYYEESYANFGETSAVDVFADATYRLTDKLELSAGLRVTQEEITAGYESRNGPTPARLGFILTGGSTNNAFRPTPGRLEISDDYASWVARMAARYEFAPELNLFASVARGRRPNSLSFNQSTLAPVELDEEIVWNYETGLKGYLSGIRATYGVSAFYYDYSNFQTQAITSTGVTTATDAGAATGYGFELNFQSAVSDHVTLFAAYGYTNATFDDTDDDGQPQAYAGNTFRLTAKHTLALGATFTLPLEAGRLFATPVYQYKSRHYFDDDNASAGGSLFQDGFSLVNLRAGFRTRDGRWEIAGYVDNLFDEDYLIDAGNTGNAFGIPTFVAGPPRFYGASATLRF
ncbi:MAG TPA: TonB-dependent receptor [Opitutaceae bacterium]